MPRAGSPFPRPPDEFHLIAAHDQGFAWVTNKELAASGDLRLEPWGRIEGTLKIGRELGAGERVSLCNRGGNRRRGRSEHSLRLRDLGGQRRAVRVREGSADVDGGRLHDPGRRLHVELHQQNADSPAAGTEPEDDPGRGRPAGRSASSSRPPDYTGDRSISAKDCGPWRQHRPDCRQPANYSQMTKREQQQWRERME